MLNGQTPLSVIALLPAIGNAVSAPLKAIFNAVGNSTGITKAINTLGILFGGSGKIVSKLDGIGIGLKKFLNKIPSALASIKNNFVVKSIIGSKNLNNIIAGVKKGISNLISRSNQVISAVKKAVKKDIKKEAKAKSSGLLKTDLQFFASKEADNVTRMTTKQVSTAAKKLGYEPTNYIAKSGEKVYFNKKTKTYISQDIGSGNGMGSHKGGVWKTAKSPQALNSKETRIGTYDANMNRIGD